MTRAAAGFAWLTGLLFGLPGVYGLWFFAEYGHVWFFRGFPTYGRGPLEALGIETTVVLIAGFLVVCVAEIIVGAGLWVGQRWGSWLALGLLPVELAYWFGFNLPIALILGLARTGCVVADRVRTIT